MSLNFFTETNQVYINEISCTHYIEVYGFNEFEKFFYDYIAFQCLIKYKDKHDKYKLKDNEYHRYINHVLLKGMRKETLIKYLLIDKQILKLRFDQRRITSKLFLDFYEINIGDPKKEFEKDFIIFEKMKSMNQKNLKVDSKTNQEDLENQEGGLEMNQRNLENQEKDLEINQRSLERDLEMNQRGDLDIEKSIEEINLLKKQIKKIEKHIIKNLQKAHRTKLKK
jgi:hypothetical protein